MWRNKDGSPVGDSEFDHENRFKQNFWNNYCKTLFEFNKRISPQTTEEGCYKYFCEKLRHKHRKKQFKIPKWMKVLNNPNIEFDLSPPKYNEISSIIRKMRAKASPSPFHQISVIVFKKCPILRTVLWKIVQRSWEIRSIPSQWRKALSVLAYKN